MSWLNELLQSGSEFFNVVKEAARLDEEHWKAKGWTRDEKGWHPPAGGGGVGNPGSVESISTFVEQAAKNLKVDISQWQNIAQIVRSMLTMAESKRKR